MLIVFQIPRKIFAELGPNSDSSAASDLTTYTDFQVCGKMIPFRKVIYVYILLSTKFSPPPSPHFYMLSTHVSAFRIGYVTILMVPLRVLPMLLHVVSVYSQTTLPPYWWWNRNDNSSCIFTVVFLQLYY